MCKIVEDIVAKEVTDEKKNVALRMLERGELSNEEIAEDLDNGLADRLQPV